MTRYSVKELEEFKEIILEKLERAKKELKFYQDQVRKSSDKHFRGLEDGANTLAKESLNELASRQVKFIQHLEKALIRIENRTYGVCRVTGKLISKERLKVVPHATLSIEAKLAQRKA